jgi:hypothetical protein
LIDSAEKGPGIAVGKLAKDGATLAIHTITLLQAISASIVSASSTLMMASLTLTLLLCIVRG